MTLYNAFICSICYKEYNSSSACRVFVCELCLEEFPEDRLICSFCSKRFVCKGCRKGWLEKVVCNICNAEFSKNSNLKRHIRNVHDKANQQYLCSYCEKTFCQKSNLSRHIISVHNMYPEDVIFSVKKSDDVSATVSETETQEACAAEENSNETSTKTVSEAEAEEACKENLSETSTKDENTLEMKEVLKGIKEGNGCAKCIECDICFTNLPFLRSHLQMHHKRDMSEKVFHFPNMSAFHKWKHELEKKELTRFIKKTGNRKTNLCLKSFYHCHRSGIKTPKRLAKGERQRIIKRNGSQKLGMECTAGIYCSQYCNEVVVNYFPNHYGHGNEVPILHVSPEEQAAMEENEASGTPLTKLLDDGGNMHSADVFQVKTLKDKDCHFIKNALNVDEYTPCISELESVDQWVNMCCQMEESPVLYYRREVNVDSKEDFMLIIMTEFQKQILMSSSMQVVCVDSVGFKKGLRIQLIVLLIMDEYDVAFPVAFCFSNEVNKNAISQFLTSIKESTGPLLAKFFMSSSQKFYYESWVEVMNDDSCQWLWSTWIVLDRFRQRLNKFNLSVEAREKLFITIKKLTEIQNEDVFTTMFRNCLDDLLADSRSEMVANCVMERFDSNQEMWASCFRKDFKFSASIHLEMMHRTFQYCCVHGRNKRLDKFIFVVMKYVKYKMLARLSNVSDEEKIALSIEAIDASHKAGLEIPSRCISSLSDKIWLIHSEESEECVYVTRDCETCFEHCNLQCSECDVCVHMYSCSCVQSLINANLCEHIHAVVWKFVMPDFSPPSSPVQETYDEMEVDNADTIPDSCSELLQNALKRTHDVFKNLRKNRCRLNKFTLTEIVKKLNDINNMCEDDDMNSCEPPSMLNDDSGCAVNPVAIEGVSRPHFFQKVPTLLPSPVTPLSQYVYLVSNCTTDIKEE